MTFTDTTVCKTTTFSVCATPPSSTLPNLEMDDKFSSAIAIGFPFTFYGQTFTQLVISDNNFISFNTALAGQVSMFKYQDALSAGQVDNAIMFPFQDLNPSNGNGIIRYKTTGTAPNRKFIIEYCNVGYYSCSGISATDQLILYEGSNIIEMHIGQKQECATWPIATTVGKGVQGVRATSNATAVFAPGRGPASTTWTVSSPEGKRFTPAGSSSYTISNVTYAQEPFFNPGGTFAWYAQGSSTPFATSNCVNITTDTAVDYYIAVYTGTIGCNSNVTMTAQDTVFVHHTNIFTPKTLTYCQSALPATWNGLTIPAGATSQANYDTVLVAGGTCDTNFIVSLNITPAVIPTFTQVDTICANATLTPLPTTSLNGVSGSWSPALNNTATTTYTFTPNGNICATPVTMTIAVKQNVQPYFNLYPPYCIGSNIPALPTTSTNGISGFWTPSTISNTASGTYIFHGTSQQCTLNFEMFIQINNNTVPTFTQPDPICMGSSTIGSLPTTSNNNIHGTWSPAFNNNATTTYTFTPDTGQCAVPTTMTIQVLPILIPSFTQVPPVCAGGPLGPLPTTSNNGFTGTWSPAINNSTTTTYTFTPNPGQCASATTMTIQVLPNSVTPAFAAIAPVCYGSAANPLPTTSTNGVSGSWSPAWNNTATTTYTFTPNPGQCATNTTLTVTVNSIVPSFAPIAAVCYGAANPLPAASTNGISGSWSPAWNNAATTTYTFTPNPGQCAVSTTLTVAVNSTTPTFNQVAPACAGATLSPLPTTSTNGITGTWSPALNNTATTTYTFTPAAGQCATSTTMTIVINNATPLFNQVSSICQGATLAPLPTTSTNGITGTWNPAVNNNTTTTYTFTPTAGQCATSTTMTVTVIPNTVPVFNQEPSVCLGTKINPLPTTSLNGVTGHWSPTANSNITTTYTFTPNPGQCASTATMTIVVNPIVTTVFTQVPAICAGASLSPLPTTSNNGIQGSWSPAINNMATTTYTFIPDTNQCAEPTQMTITVNPPVVPAFAPVTAVCAGATLSPLPTTSTNGISGTWSPALNNTTTTTYTFTPTAGQCATTTTLTIQINNNTPPTFTQVAPICAGATLNALPTTSTNNITGTWSPAINNTTTTTYTFTPTAGQCATTATMTVTVNPVVTPTFAAVAPICAGATLSALPTTSANSITGTWSPALNNTATTTYTFTPTAGQCANTATMTITVNPVVTPTFTAVPPICAGATLSALPTTSTNSITGTWSPALNNTTTTTYTFTPTAGQCANTTTMTIQVNNNTVPTFAQVAPICTGGTLNALPTTSTNSITGTWSPALNNTATTTYTFTPTAGQCATTTTMTVTVNPIVTPTFTPVGPVCAGTSISALPSASLNGISGSWSPAINNMATTTYTFTPAAGQCANTTTMTITITPSITPAFVQVNPICSGATLAPLPATSTNGISGTWAPVLNNTTTTTYTFTPAPGQCALPTSMTITVNPIVTPVFAPAGPFCAGTPISPLATTSTNGVTGTWSPAINNMATTTYTFTPGSSTQCITGTTMTIVINPYLTGVRNAAICEGNSYTFNGVTYTASVSGVKDTIPNANACDSIITLNLSVYPKTTGIQPATICQGSAYVFNGISYTTNNNTAKDTLVNSHGCDSIVTLNLTVIPVNPVTASFNMEGCGSVIFNGVSYTSSTIVKDTLHTQQGCDSLYRTTNITVYPAYHYGQTIDTSACGQLVYNGVTYTHSVTIKDTLYTVHGCDSVINNINIQIVDFDLQATVTPEDPYEGEEVHIQTNANLPYTVISWTPAALFPDQTATAQTFNATTGQYVVITGMGPGSCIDTAVVSFKVRPYDPDIRIPNAFTPNGDGRNDVFVPVLSIDRGYQLTDFRIFNRWGQLLFSTAQVNVGWDGTFKGELQSQDVYFYAVTVILMDGTRKFFKGDVTLLR